MNKSQILTLLTALIASSLSSQTVTLDNGIAKLDISLTGGAITELSLNSIDLNPIHQYGHFICFDRWGPSSPEDLALGIPWHGNGSKVTWTLHEGPILKEDHYFAEMSCLLPIVKLGLNRKIYLNSNSSVFKIVEEISNHDDSTKVFNLVQHPTIGAPFLDESTIVDTEVDSGFSQAGNLPPTPADVFTWPEAVVDGDSTDLRYLSGDYTWWGPVVSFILDEKEEYRWVTAVNPSLNLMVGYIWPTSDYPWLNLWSEIKSSVPFARGLEFGSTGLHQPWPELLEMDTIFGKKLYETIDVDTTVLKSYYAFLSEIPSDYKGVESVTIVGDTIKVEEYGMDPERSIELDISGFLTGIEDTWTTQSERFILSQNFPNPFSSETSIEYSLPIEGKVLLEVFNARGQSVRIPVDEFQRAGKYKVTFNTSGLSSGMYYYRLIAGSKQLQKKMICFSR
jgi:hypothetical protein